VHLNTGSYSENGTAGLYGGSDNSDVTYTTLGIRAGHSFRLSQVDAKLHGMLGWQHAFGDTTSSATHAFVTSNAFTVTGVPIAEDAAIVKAGIDFGVTKSTTFGFAYQGRFGSNARENVVSANLNVAF
ncbi:autotransporter domain-containing protein, partial [Martelella sp. HB161492]|uniref:autotransporter outer membrane beta-barrel domain-containing protein n=1 Tax=Martelella sp. HB161492 TaxID=2720726 RepID=UPI00158FEA3B